MHYFMPKDQDQDPQPCCSDYCHQQVAGDDYEGWNGCHEGADYDQECANCGDIILGIESQEPSYEYLISANRVAVFKVIARNDMEAIDQGKKEYLQILRNGGHSWDSCVALIGSMSFSIKKMERINQ